MRTPRTLNERFAHDLDQPGVTDAKRIYYRGSRSGDWYAADRARNRIILVAVIVVVALLAWSAQ